ncbi:helix-turn-helix transcriptional regulator [Erythrobacter sp. LQ02-29]|uniref:helix-turn-helix domain-containing protein n=1 Tax=unclassified Erythrobacter TaxID=2633097 RepID=UPI001BFC3B62|nr:MULTISPECIES: helix-turn-helix transcriptional regulator [unclassified Erythrobacter]MCP9222292.1 helix-turn-helix transcriptional regulator [Erythrobacter sp. LQ02-29]QWC56405.1 helix-turn-helix domain-containing protein [Erythrobacter sp. 3-20A1M]
MPITITLDRLLKDRGLLGKEVAETVGLSETQLSLFRSGKVRGIRFSTLARLCFALDCEPGDLLGYAKDPADMAADRPGESS